VEEIGISEENHRSTPSEGQIVSHKVVSSTPLNITEMLITGNLY